MKTGVPAARIEGLSKSYGTVGAVHDITFEVAPGELLTLLGPSGCGKTTTMRSIAGLEKITAGEIYLKDRLVSSVPKRIHLPPEKRDVGMVFQSYAIWPHMTVFENVAYPLNCRKVPKAELIRRVREGLHLVDMDGYEDRPATQLSGGQQQRVAFARAMVMEPSILLMDEPLSNLDAKLRVQMRGHIKALQRRTGLTMIYVTHDQDEAMALSDRIIVMKAGRIEQVGTPENVYERPQSRFVADFVGASNFIAATVIESLADQKKLKLKAGAQTLICAAAEMNSPAIGASVVLMIRPEKIEVGGNNADNQLRAAVTSNVYCGERRDLTVAVGDMTLQVSAPNDVADAPGSSVSIQFSARDLHILPQ